MRGRPSAVLVAATTAVLFWLFPPFLIVSGAAVALVTLRRGPVEGVLLMALAGLGAPVLTTLAVGVPWPMLQILGVCWLPLWLLALVLRATVSLARTLQVAAVLGLAGVLGFYGVLGDPAAWWEGVLGGWERELAALAAAGPAADRSTLDQILELLKGWAPFMPGQMVSAALLFVLLSLFLGRWWQALLFNPGGFRPEFYELGVGRPLAVFMLGLFGVGLVTGWVTLMLWCLAILSNLTAIQRFIYVWMQSRAEVLAKRSIQVVEQGK